MRNGHGRSETRPGGGTCLQHSALRLPLSALLVLLACTPVTTRPAFFPSPRAPAAIVHATAAEVVPEAVGWLESQGLRPEQASPADGYVETEWFNVRTRQSTRGSDPRDLLHTIKIRCWADPYVPGKSQLTVEAVYRPLLDPSRPERDLEVIVPEDAEGSRLAQQLIDAMKEKFGSD